MKKIFLYIMVMASVQISTSCNSKNDTEGPTVDVKDSLTLQTNEAGHYWWSADPDLLPQIQMKQEVILPVDSLHINYILNRMNESYPEIQVLPVKQYHDTMAVKIPKSRYLTEQIGSSGAQAYLAELTYNLTEVPGIHFVTILFKAGDHASPDTYTRNDFEKVKN